MSAYGHPLTCCPRHCLHPHHDEPRSANRCDHLATCTIRAPRPIIVAATCVYCGRGEADGVGVIMGGACADCRRAWG